jgi:hypothetical protein
MSDFGTILNKDNTTLDLYCHSISTVSSYPPYLYASAPTFTYNANQNQPVIFNDVIGREITADIEIPKIIFRKAGVYKLSCNLIGSATFISTFETNLFLRFNVYNSNGDLITTSATTGGNSFNAYNESGNLRTKNDSLSLDAIFNIDTGNYVEVIISTSIPPPQFNIIFAGGSLCVSFIGSF